MGRPLTSRAFDNGFDRWEVVEGAPDLQLASHVQRYSWWSEHTRTFTTRRELAGTTGVFIVNLGSDLEIVDASGTCHRLGAGEGFLGGIAQGTSLSRSTGAMEGVHVHTPLSTLSRLAGVPLAELADRVVPLSDLNAGHHLIGEQLLEANTLEQRWAALDGFIADRLQAGAPENPVIGFVLSRLAAGQRVQSLADEIGWSRRHLAQHVRSTIGLEPRAFAGLARFERFANRLQMSPDVPLAGAAIDAGYADQAHLTREVARYSQLTPGELRSRLLPEAAGVRE